MRLHAFPAFGSTRFRRGPLQRLGEMLRQHALNALFMPDLQRWPVKPRYYLHLEQLLPGKCEEQLHLRRPRI